MPSLNAAVPSRFVFFPFVSTDQVKVPFSLIVNTIVVSLDGLAVHWPFIATGGGGGASAGRAGTCTVVGVTSGAGSGERPSPSLAPTGCSTLANDFTNDADSMSLG